MAANRIESTPGADEASKVDSEASAPRAGTGGIKAWLPLIITVVAMPLLAFVMTSYVLLPRLQKGLGLTAPAAESHEKAGKEAEAKTESVTMNKLLVNVAGTLGARYLLVSVSVVGSGTDFKAKMEAHDPQLRDMACGSLASKTLADLEKPAARNLIRSELISGFNNILGGAIVKEIYLTEFAIQ